MCSNKVRMNELFFFANLYCLRIGVSKYINYGNDYHDKECLTLAAFIMQVMSILE